MAKEITAAVVAAADKEQAKKLLTIHERDNAHQFAIGQAECLRTFIKTAEMANASPDPHFWVEKLLNDMKEKVETSHKVAETFTEIIEELKEEL